MKINLKVILLCVIIFFNKNLSVAQCFEIESILVDACEGNTNAEGQNEMVRFKVGNTSINTNQMDVDWPSNNWQGLIQNATTAQKVILMNEEILAAGGCGKILEPTDGILPPNATVVLVTSHLFDITLNPFGAINENIYILFQNSIVTGGHFGNFGTSAMRTLAISFGGACTDTVSYNRSLLVDADGNDAAGNGATVEFTPNGAATYVNNGCIAPVAALVFEITEFPDTTCATFTIHLGAEVTGHESITWSSTDGVFSEPNNLTTDFTVNDTDASFVTINLTMVNLCEIEVTKSIQIPLEDRTTPLFNDLPTQVCNAQQMPNLPNVSSNGITGTWFPETVQENHNGTYVFTPSTGQCAVKSTHSISVYSFDFKVDAACDGANYLLSVSDLPHDAQYVWYNAFGTEIESNTSVLNVSDYLKNNSISFVPTEFTVEVTLNDCTVSKSIEVISINCAIQKGVSPNADNKNDFFDLRAFLPVNVVIYNRYGTKVYQKEWYKDEWYGQDKNGKLLPNGTYFYMMRTGSNETVTGWIQLTY